MIHESCLFIYQLRNSCICCLYKIIVNLIDKKSLFVLKFHFIDLKIENKRFQKMNPIFFTDNQIFSFTPSLK